MFFKRKRPAPNASDTLAAAPATHVEVERDTPTLHDTQSVRLVEEVAEVSKRAVPTETVRVQTVTDTVTEPYEIDLRRENYRVERVAVNTVVTTIPEIRRENGVTIIPVLEERLVTIKEVVLREEIRLHPEHDVETKTGEVELRRQRAVIDREPLVTD